MSTSTSRRGSWLGSPPPSTAGGSGAGGLGQLSPSPSALRLATASPSPIGPSSSSSSSSQLAPLECFGITSLSELVVLPANATATAPAGAVPQPPPVSSSRAQSQQHLLLSAKSNSGSGTNTPNGGVWMGGQRVVMGARSRGNSVSNQRSPSLSPSPGPTSSAFSFASYPTLSPASPLVSNPAWSLESMDEEQLVQRLAQLARLSEASTESTTVKLPKLPREILLMRGGEEGGGAGGAAAGTAGTQGGSKGPSSIAPPPAPALANDPWHNFLVSFLRRSMPLTRRLFDHRLDTSIGLFDASASADLSPGASVYTTWRLTPPLLDALGEVDWKDERWATPFARGTQGTQEVGGTVKWMLERYAQLAGEGKANAASSVPSLTSAAAASSVSTTATTPLCRSQLAPPRPGGSSSRPPSPLLLHSFRYCVRSLILSTSSYSSFYASVELLSLSMGLGAQPAVLDNLARAWIHQNLRRKLLLKRELKRQMAELQRHAYFTPHAFQWNTDALVPGSAAPLPDVGARLAYFHWLKSTALSLHNRLVLVSQEIADLKKEALNGLKGLWSLPRTCFGLCEIRGDYDDTDPLTQVLEEEEEESDIQALKHEVWKERKEGAAGEEEEVEWWNKLVADQAALAAATPSPSSSSLTRPPLMDDPPKRFGRPPPGFHQTAASPSASSSLSPNRLKAESAKLQQQRAAERAQRRSARHQRNAVRAQRRKRESQRKKQMQLHGPAPGLYGGAEEEVDDPGISSDEPDTPEGSDLDTAGEEHPVARALERLGKEDENWVRTADEEYRRAEYIEGQKVLARAYQMYEAERRRRLQQQQWMQAQMQGGDSQGRHQGGNPPFNVYEAYVLLLCALMRLKVHEPLKSKRTRVAMLKAKDRLGPQLSIFSPLASATALAGAVASTAVSAAGAVVSTAGAVVTTAVSTAVSAAGAVVDAVLSPLSSPSSTGAHDAAAVALAPPSRATLEEAVRQGRLNPDFLPPLSSTLRVDTTMASSPSSSTSTKNGAPSAVDMGAASNTLMSEEEMFQELHTYDPCAASASASPLSLSSLSPQFDPTLSTWKRKTLEGFATLFSIHEPFCTLARLKLLSCNLNRTKRYWLEVRDCIEQLEEIRPVHISPSTNALGVLDSTLDQPAWTREELLCYTHTLHRITSWAAVCFIHQQRVFNAPLGIRSSREQWEWEVKQEEGAEERKRKEEEERRKKESLLAMIKKEKEKDGDVKKLSMVAEETSAEARGEVLFSPITSPAASSPTSPPVRVQMSEVTSGAERANNSSSPSSSSTPFRLTDALNTHSEAFEACMSVLQLSWRTLHAIDIQPLPGYEASKGSTGPAGVKADAAASASIPTATASKLPTLFQNGNAGAAGATDAASSSLPKLDDWLTPLLRERLIKLYEHLSWCSSRMMLPNDEASGPNAMSPRLSPRSPSGNRASTMTSPVSSPSSSPTSSSVNATPSSPPLDAHLHLLLHTILMEVQWYTRLDERVITPAFHVVSSTRCNSRTAPQAHVLSRPHQWVSGLVREVFLKHLVDEARTYLTRLRIPHLLHRMRDIASPRGGITSSRLALRVNPANGALERDEEATEETAAELALQDAARSEVQRDIHVVFELHGSFQWMFYALQLQTQEHMLEALKTAAAAANPHQDASTLPAPTLPVSSGTLKRWRDLSKWFEPLAAGFVDSLIEQIGVEVLDMEQDVMSATTTSSSSKVTLSYLIARVDSYLLQLLNKPLTLAHKRKFIDALGGLMLAYATLYLMGSSKQTQPQQQQTPPPKTPQKESKKDTTVPASASPMSINTPSAIPTQTAGISEELQIRYHLNRLFMALPPRKDKDKEKEKDKSSKDKKSKSTPVPSSEVDLGLHLGLSPTDAKMEHKFGYDLSSSVPGLTKGLIKRFNELVALCARLDQIQVAVLGGAEEGEEEMEEEDEDSGISAGSVRAPCGPSSLLLRNLLVQSVHFMCAGLCAIALPRTLHNLLYLQTGSPLATASSSSSGSTQTVVHWNQATIERCLSELFGFFYEHLEQLKSHRLHRDLLREVGMGLLFQFVTPLQDEARNQVRSFTQGVGYVKRRDGLDTIWTREQLSRVNTAITMVQDFLAEVCMVPKVWFTSSMPQVPSALVDLCAGLGPYAPRKLGEDPYAQGQASMSGGGNVNVAGNTLAPSPLPSSPSSSFLPTWHPSVPANNYPLPPGWSSALLVLCELWRLERLISIHQSPTPVLISLYNSMVDPVPMLSGGANNMIASPSVRRGEEGEEEEESKYEESSGNVTAAQQYQQQLTIQVGTPALPSSHSWNSPLLPSSSSFASSPFFFSSSSLLLLPHPFHVTGLSAWDVYRLLLSRSKIHDDSAATDWVQQLTKKKRLPERPKDGEPTKGFFAKIGRALGMKKGDGNKTRG